MQYNTVLHTRYGAAGRDLASATAYTYTLQYLLYG